MDESEILFIFFYIIGCAVIIYPPKVFETSGLTLEQIFGSWLGTEKILFIRYHQRRTAMNLLFYSSMPQMFFSIYEWKFFQSSALGKDEILVVIFSVLNCLSTLIVIFVLGVLGFWRINNWQNHPISKTLAKFSNNSDAISVAEDICTQFRRANCFCSQLNPLHKVIVLDSWIIKTTPFGMYVAHQSDTTLVVEKSEIYEFAQDSEDTIEMVTIKVQTNRPNVNGFHLRINVMNFNSLQDNLNRKITVPENVKFHENNLDKFINVFKEQVAKNPIYQTNQTADKCFGCLVAEPNIKLNKQCIDIDENDEPMPDEQCCKNCYCRPMWCVDCFARWFAARQHDVDKHIWLQQKCTCPLCRTKFCLLDVCYIEKI